MTIYKKVPLKQYNTFGLNCTAEFMIHIRTERGAAALFNGSTKWKKPFFILGGGSNILFTSDFEGTIFYPELKGIRIEKEESDKKHVIVSAGAGVNWDDFVAWSVNKGFGGLENLSLIPGKVGATPVQNIGAYGVEVKDLIVKVNTISTNNGDLRVFSNHECQFGYRTSIFKKSEKAKYLVTRVYYRLTTNPRLNLSYGALKEEVQKLGINNLRNVRQAVINIRMSKLPDPEIIGNAGSFFKNTVVQNQVADRLKIEYPDLPVFKDREGFMKLASGWLIERCGWKGKRKGDAGIHDKQALVIINYGNATGREIYDLAEEVRISVYEKFGVDLEREVEVVGII